GGVVCAASYEARPFGVRSAMPMARALRLCPHLVVVPPAFTKYSAVSDQVFEIFHSFTPEVEGLSLDEAFLDVTRSQALLGTPRAQPKAIKARIRQRTQLTASVGIAEVKFAAKIASELSKPDGLLEVPRGQVREFLAPLPASRLWGVGPRTDEQLQRLGLRKVGDVACADPAYLEAQLGSMGPWLHDRANGSEPRKVEAHPVRLTGVHAGDLHTGAPQLGLFDAGKQKRDRLNRSLDAIAEKFGAGAVLPADLVQTRKK